MKFGEQCKLTDEAPKGTKYVLIYADFCQYFKRKNQAEVAKAKLPYYYQEDAMIEAYRPSSQTD